MAKMQLFNLVLAFVLHLFGRMEIKSVDNTAVKSTVFIQASDQIRVDQLSLPPSRV